MRLRYVVLFLVLLFASTSCTPPRQQVPVFVHPNKLVAQLHAAEHAARLQGVYYECAPTGSMEPFLTGGDFVVVQRIPYADVRAGMLANYQARWRPADSATVTHWVAARHGKEWIMDGQANAHYEKHESQRMGEKEFRGKVVAVYRAEKK